MVIPLGTGRSESFLIREKNTFLVDTGASPDIQNFLELLAEHDTKPEDLSLIIITHGHIDHFVLLPELRKRCTAPVLCHKLAAEAITSGASVPSVLHSGLARFLLKAFGMKEPPYQPGLVPDVTITDEKDLTPYGINAKIILTPGHTDCSISVITADGEAIIGDMLLDRPLSRKTGFTFVAADPGQLKASLKKAVSCGCHTFYSAHARKYTRVKLDSLIT
ncbi:MAG: MBL fold metallo-hydrolase [Spirochaetales bacterium]|nr:MBL fold metallo-hydrolase [Spirochaetales bacterium]